MKRQMEEALVRYWSSVTHCFVLLAAAGLSYAALATYLYFRFERSAADNHVRVAISAFAMHYSLVFGSRYARGDVLLPTLLLFLMPMTLVLVIC